MSVLPPASILLSFQYITNGVWFAVLELQLAAGSPHNEAASIPALETAAESLTDNLRAVIKIDCAQFQHIRE